MSETPKPTTSERDNIPTPGEGEKVSKKTPFRRFSPEELAVAHQDCREAMERGQLHMVGELEPRLRRDYLDPTLDGIDPIKRATTNISVTPTFFRRMLELSCAKVTGDVIERHGRNLSFIYPWRAGLAFLRGAARHGIQNHGHIGLGRNHADVESDPIEYMPLETDVLERLNGGKIVIADPMLASCGSQLDVIKKLLALGIPEDKILSASIVSAPEGIQRLLRKHPAVDVFTHTLDDHLDERGYIVPGLGDAGDKYCEDLKIDEFAAFREGCFSETQWAALEKRLQNC